MARLVELVQSHLPKTDKEEDSSHIKDKAQSNTAFKVRNAYSSWFYYRQVSYIRRTKSQHLKDSRTVLRLSLGNPLKPDVKSRMKM